MSAQVEETIITVEWDITVSIFFPIFLLKPSLFSPSLPQFLHLSTSILKNLLPSSSPWVGIITTHWEIKEEFSAIHDQDT